MPVAEYFYQAFMYATGWITLSTTAGTAVNTTLSIAADYDFLCNFITISVRQANVLFANFAGDVQINDSAAGRNFGNVAFPIHSIAGSGQQPYPLNPPRKMVKNSSLSISFTNNFTTATDCNLVFHGNKIIPVTNAI